MRTPISVVRAIALHLALAGTLTSCGSNSNKPVTSGPTCSPEQTLCNADGKDAGGPHCANTLTDNANCGTCGNQCEPSEACSSGQCTTTTCQPSETLCGADSDAGVAPYCANVQTDNANCGCCGNACGPNQGCQNGRCNATGSFSFFLFGDMHTGVPNYDARVQTAINQMNQIDPNAVAAFSNGDLVDAAGTSNWNDHETLIGASEFHPDALCATSFGALARYFGSVGNHDDNPPGNWTDLWNQYLPAQQSLGPNRVNGIYYSVTYGSAVFFMLDSEQVSSPSWQDPQTTWLATELAKPYAQNAQLKFIFFHEPIYACSYHPPFAAGLPWVDLAEKNNVNVIFGSHTHVYTRSCPKKGGNCTSDGTGIVFVETGAVGGDSRPIEVTSATTVVGTDAAGNARTDTYYCALGQDLVASSELHNDFCHVTVASCLATVNCYFVADGNTAPFDTFTVNGCQADAG